MSDETPNVPKKLAIFVDGQNLYGMVSALGVKVDYRRLFQFLCDQEPEMELYAPPTLTLSARGMENMEGVLRGAGFDPRLETRSGGDKLMTKLIDQLPPEEVGTVVLVSGDGDYAEALGRCVAREIRVSIVSLADNISDNRSASGHGYGCSHQLRQNPSFQFVDILHHIDELRLNDVPNGSEDRMEPRDASPITTVTPLSTCYLTLTVEVSAELVRDASRWLAGALADFSEDFPEANASLRIERT